MRTEVDLTKFTPYQREVLTALVRPLSKNDVMRLTQIVEATMPSAGRISGAMKQTILHRARAVIGDLARARRLLAATQSGFGHALLALGDCGWNQRPSRRGSFRDGRQQEKGRRAFVPSA